MNSKKDAVAVVVALANAVAVVVAVAGAVAVAVVAKYSN